MPVENSNSIASPTSFKRKKLFYSGGAVLNFLLVLIVIILFFVLFEAKNRRNLSRHPTGIFRKEKK